MTTSVYCPGCRRKVVQAGADGRLKIRTRLIALEKGGQTVVVCPDCGRDVPVGLQAEPDLWSQAQPPKLTIRKKIA